MMITKTISLAAPADIVSANGCPRGLTPQRHRGIAMRSHAAMAIDAAAVLGANIDNSNGIAVTTAVWAYAATIVETTFATPTCDHTAFVTKEHSQRKRPT